MLRGTNCLFWAVRMWWRRGGVGYIAFRRSRWGRFPHFLYVEMRRPGGLPVRARMVSYVPVQPRHKDCPPPLFAGRVKWGDA